MPVTAFSPKTVPPCPNMHPESMVDLDNPKDRFLLKLLMRINALEEQVRMLIKERL